MQLKKSILFILISVLLLSHNSFAQPANDDCSGAINIGTLPAPAACPSGLGNIVATNGTLVGATPSVPYITQPNCSGGTQASMANDVWYIYTASSNTGVFSITCTFANPNIAIYSGSCLLMGGGVGGCAVGAGGTVSLTINQMTSGQTYLVQISGDVGQTGTFTFNARNNFNCSNCLVESDLTVNPLPVNGMYQPGDVVNFCFTISDYVQANTNWLHGVQITYGAGWQGISNQVSPAPVAGTGAWGWYNAATSSANGTNWGPGFYIDLDGDGNPGNNFGDDCVQDGFGGNDLPCIGGLSWTFCFTMTVSPICTPGSDLSVTINTSGDGESGSWQDLGCAGDPPYIFNAIGSCCPPAMSSAPESCAGTDGTATATPVGNMGPYTYHWTGPGGYDQINANINGLNTVTGLAAGNYTVTVTDINSCVVSNTVVVAGGSSNVPAPGTAPITYCQNDVAVPLTATTTPGGILNWYGTNQVGGVASPNAPTPSTPTIGATTYYVSQSVGNCEGPRASITVTINQPATANAGPAQTICETSTVQLAGNVGGSSATGTWSGGAGNYVPNNTTLNSVYTPSAGEIAAGTVTLTLTSSDPAGPCPVATSTVIITVNSVATIDAGPDQTICTGNPATLAGAFDGNANSGTWTGGAGTYNPNNSTPNADYTPSFAEQAAGSVTLTFVSNDPTGPCPSVTDDVIISIIPSVTSDAGPDQTICEDGIVQLAGVIGGGATSGTWTGGNGTYAPNNTTVGAVYTPSVAEVAAATVTLTLTTNDPVGPCPAATDQVVITINQLPTANAGISQSVCSGDSIILAGIIGGSASSGRWSGGAGNFIPNNTTLNAIYVPDAAEFAAGSVTLTLTTDDPAGPCNSATASVTHNFFPLPVTQLSVDIPSGCPEHCVNFSDLSISGAGNIASWDWDFGDGTSNVNLQNPAHCYDQTGFYDVTLSIVTNNGCEDKLTIPQMIEVFALPVAEFTANPDRVSILDARINFIDQSSPDVTSWFWDFGNGSTLSPDISNPEYTYPSDSSGYFLVTLIVQNADGCYDTVSHEIFVESEFTFYIPNCFTPNSNGKNEYFFAKGIGIVDFDLWIFDRWGNEIFHGIDLNDKWDGRVFERPNLTQEDVYVWKVNLTDILGEKHDYIGHVTVVR